MIGSSAQGGDGRGDACAQALIERGDSSAVVAVPVKGTWQHDSVQLSCEGPPLGVHDIQARPPRPLILAYCKRAHPRDI
jgi:hypothetical protein